MSSRKLSELPLATSTLPSDGTIVISSANDGSKRISLADFIELVGGNIDVIDNLNSTSTTDPLSANQGRVLKGLIDSKPSSDDIPTALSDLTEDSTHRTVTDAEKTLWNNLQVEVVDNLNSNDGTKALSAKQGKVLKELIDNSPTTKHVAPLDTRISLPDPDDFDEGYTFQLVNCGVDPTGPFRELNTELGHIFRAGCLNKDTAAFCPSPSSDSVCFLSKSPEDVPVGYCWLSVSINYCSSMPEPSDFYDYTFCSYNDTYYYENEDKLIVPYEGVIETVDFLPKDEELSTIDCFDPSSDWCPSTIFKISDDSSIYYYYPQNDNIYQKQGSTWKLINGLISNEILYRVTEKIHDLSTTAMSYTTIGTLEMSNGDVVPLSRRVYYLDPPLTIASNTWEETTISTFGSAALFKCQCVNMSDNIVYGGISASAGTHSHLGAYYIKLYNGNPIPVTIDYIVIEVVNL